MTESKRTSRGWVRIVLAVLALALVGAIVGYVTWRRPPPPKAAAPIEARR